LAGGNDGILVYSLKTPEDPLLKFTYDTPGTASSLAINGPNLYVADGKGGVRVLEIRSWDPFQISEISSFSVRGKAQHLITSGNQLYVTDSKNQLSIQNIKTPNNPQLLGTFDIHARTHDILISGSLAFLAADKRGLVILDVSNPQEINEFTTFDTPGSAKGLFKIGHHLYITDGDSGIRVLDVTDPRSIREIGHYDTSGEASGIVVRDGLAFIADGFSGLQVVAAQVQVKAQEVGASAAQRNIEAVAISGNYAYLAAGDGGMRVLDISDPRFPTEVNAIQARGYAAGITVQGDLAYLSERSEGLRLIDISDPEGRLSTAGVINIGQDAQKSIIVGDFLYLAEGKAGFRVIDNTNPLVPVEIGHLDTPGNAVGLAVSGNLVYLADGEAGLRIINIENPLVPAEIGAFDTPGEARAVSLLLRPVTSAGAAQAQTGEMQFQTYALVADGSRGLRVLNVTNPRAPREVSSYETPQFVQDVVILGNYAFVAAREGGLLLLDLTDPRAPKQVGGYNTPGKALSLVLKNNLAYIADFERGLRVVDITDLSQPREIGFYDSPEHLSDLSLVGDQAYVVDGVRGLWAVDVADARAVREKGFLATSGAAKRVSVYGNHAYIVGGAEGVSIVDIANPLEMQLVGVFDTPGNAQEVFVRDELAYLADGISGLLIYDLRDKSAVKILGAVNTPGAAFDLDVAGEYAYVADGPAGFQIIKVSEVFAPVKVGVIDSLHDVRSVVVHGPYAYLAGGVEGFHIVDVSAPIRPEIVATLPTPGPVEDVYVSGFYAFLTMQDRGLLVVDVTDARKPVIVGRSEIPGKALRLEALRRPPVENRPGWFNVYVASDTGGIRIVEVVKTLRPQSLGLYETPGTATPRQIFDHLVAQLYQKPEGVSQKAARTFRLFLIDVIVFAIGGTYIWLAFFAQFTLPVTDLRARRAAVGRLFAFLTGRHGMAVHVRAGHLVQRTGEALRRGPGVVLVDLSSAIVLVKRGMSRAPVIRPLLRRLTIFKRVLARYIKVGAQPKVTPRIHVEGPGVVFTGGSGYDEGILGVVDLRPQVRTQPEVQVYTSEGIELSCTVMVKFTLGEPPVVLPVIYEGEQKMENLRVAQLEEKPLPAQDGKPASWGKVVTALKDELDELDKGEIHRWVQARRKSGKPPGPTKAGNPRPPQDLGAALPLYHVDEQRVFAAIAAEAKEVYEGRTSDWTELPARAATEVFRNLIAKHKYDDLYQLSDPQAYSVNDLKSDFGIAVRNLGILAYQFVERHDRRGISVGQLWDPEELRFYPGRELQQAKVLRARGIKVLYATFTELRPVNPEVYQQRLDTWRARWQREAILKRVDADLVATRMRNKARIKGQREMAERLIKILKAAPQSREATALRIFQALEAAAADPVTRRLLPETTVNVLIEISDRISEPDEELTGARDERLSPEKEDDSESP